jgi:hypothetical protein
MPYPKGYELANAGKCPNGFTNALACIMCPFGHLTECHSPMSCEEAQCGHWQREVESQTPAFWDSEP